MTDEQAIRANIEFLLDYGGLGNPEPHLKSLEDGFLFDFPVICRTNDDTDARYNHMRKLLYETDTGRIVVPQVPIAEGEYSMVGLFNVDLERGSNDNPFYATEFRLTESDWEEGKQYVVRVPAMTLDDIQNCDSEKGFPGVFRRKVPSSTHKDTIAQYLLAENEGTFGEAHGDIVIQKSIRQYNAERLRRPIRTVQVSAAKIPWGRK